MIRGSNVFLLQRSSLSVWSLMCLLPANASRRALAGRGMLLIEPEQFCKQELLVRCQCRDVQTWYWPMHVDSGMQFPAEYVSVSLVCFLFRILKFHPLHWNYPLCVIMVSHRSKAHVALSSLFLVLFFTPGPSNFLDIISLPTSVCSQCGNVKENTINVIGNQFYVKLAQSRNH